MVKSGLVEVAKDKQEEMKKIIESIFKTESLLRDFKGIILNEQEETEKIIEESEDIEIEDEEEEELELTRKNLG